MTEAAIKDCEIVKYTDDLKIQILDVLQLNIPDFFAPEEIDDFENYLIDFKNSYYVLKLQGVLVGGCGIKKYHEKETAFISWSFINPTYHKRGLGTRLTQHCLNLIFEDNVKTIEVHTSQYAYKFFERFGFETIETKKNHWAPSFDLYRMTFNPSAERYKSQWSLSHEKRQIRCVEMLQLSGWTLKIYYIGDTIDTQFIIKAKDIAKKALPKIPYSNERYGIGFIIVHPAKLFNQITIDWWENVNELRHRVFKANPQNGYLFNDITYRGEPFCVWELKVIGYERDMWVNLVLNNNDVNRFQIYNSNHLNLSA